MNTFRTAVMTGATALAILAFAPANAFVDSSEPRKITLKYDESELSSQHGAAALYSRMRSRELRQKEAYKACYQQALGDAVLHINRETLTALHARATHGERAS
jgi:UrcA family protein